MDIAEDLQNDTIIVTISGEIDGMNVNEVEQALREASDKAPKMLLDLTDLEYISSAGLRVLLLIRKLTEGRGHKLSLRNVSDDVMEILTVTGFVKLLTIEE